LTQEPVPELPRRPQVGAALLRPPDERHLMGYALLDLRRLVDEGDRLAVLDAHVAGLGRLELPRSDAEQIEQLDEGALRGVGDMGQDGVEVRWRDVASGGLLMELREGEPR